MATLPPAAHPERSEPELSPLHDVHTHALMSAPDPGRHRGAPPAPPVSSDAGRRCRCGVRCSSRTPRYDDCGDRTGSEPALLDHPGDGLCRACTGRLELALSELPDLLARLSAAVLPTLAVRYESVLATTGLDHSPVPLNVAADALIRLVDHETASWAEHVAAAHDVDWSSADAAALDVDGRVRQSCALLGWRVVQWLALGEHEYLARSLTEDPTCGHDEDTTTRFGREWWCRRDGPDAAVLVLDLHRRAERATAELRATVDMPDWVPSPCAACASRTVWWHETLGVYRCHTCGDCRSEGAHLQFVAAATRVAEAARLAPADAT